MQQFALATLHGAQRQCATISVEHPEVIAATAVAVQLSQVLEAQRYLEHAAPDPVVSSTLNVSDLLSESLRAVEPELPLRTVVHCEFVESAFALAHAGSLKHVLTNLLHNAAEALVDCASPELHLDIWCPDAGSLWVLIEDTGSGMTEEVRARSFEPFYSGKRSGPALGLGLTVARQLSEQMGGFVELSSAKGIGTTVLLGLRRAEAADPAIDSRADLDQRPQLLIIDDDELPLCSDVCASLAKKFHVTTLPVANAFAHVLVPRDYDLVLFNCTGGESRAVSFLVALSVSRPEQAARVVLVQAASMEPRRRRSLSDAGVWQLDGGLASSELLESIEQLLTLWNSLGLSNPRLRSVRGL